MRGVLAILFVCFLFHFVPYASCRRHHHHRHHLHHHYPKNHFIRKRSTTVKSIAPINSLVDDVSESTAFRDREKKLRLIAEAGELYPEHSQELVKRKTIPHPPIIKIHKKVDDENDAIKKFNIKKDDDIDTSDNENDDDDAESGDSDDNDSNDDQNDNNNKDDDNEDDKTTIQKGRKRCHRRCKTPLTFQQCAFPRCSQKYGTIKDLCFFLCKHQKKRCEDVCE